MKLIRDRFDGIPFKGKKRTIKLTPVPAAARGDGVPQAFADGSRHGMVVDYLNGISKYTNWEYEYVDTTGSAMLKDFQAGEYELMGGCYYLPQLEETNAYPDYNTGYSRSTLLARREDHTLHSYDLESMNGKTIGVYVRAAKNIRRLEDYLSINGLDCELRYYQYEDMENGNLYHRLLDGEVDLLLANLAEEAKGLRLCVLRFPALLYCDQPGKPGNFGWSQYGAAPHPGRKSQLCNTTV